jgi:MYXO-CTERM domain-containing protein
LIFGGDLHLYMRSALLGGVSIPGLTPGSTVIIPQRQVALTGQMEDGSPVDMYLDDFPSASKFSFSESAVIKVTLVPEPVQGAAGLALVAALAARRRRSRRM